MKVEIVEVGPRDGLQNEQTQLSVLQRSQLIGKLVQSGLNRIEIAAFVSPKWVPQMTGALLLTQKIYKAFSSKQMQWSNSIKSSGRLSALVPNPKGMQDALKTPLKEIAVFGACSESFSQKNINCSIRESFDRFQTVIQMAKSEKIRVRAYLSTAFGCPYEGKVPTSKVVQLTNKLIQMGAYEVSIGDTIGVATPKQVRSLLRSLEKKVPLHKVAMHFHDTRGTALANVLASLDLGIRVFDSSIGGLGGCPYAKGASGNLSTEDLTYMLHGMGVKTGIHLESLIKTNHWLQKVLKRPLPSRVGLAGLSKALP